MFISEKDWKYLLDDGKGLKFQWGHVHKSYCIFDFD